MKDRVKAWLLLKWFKGVRVIFSVLFSLRGLRTSGEENIPRSCGAVILSNHIASIDGYAYQVVLRDPEPRYLVRTMLYRWMDWWLASLRCIRMEPHSPIKALREAVRFVQKEQGLLVLFPEGALSWDGELQGLGPGCLLFLRRGIPLVPAAMAGMYRMMPRGSLWIHPSPVWIHFGPSVGPEDVQGMEEEEILALLRERICASQQEARKRLKEWTGKDLK